MMVINHKKMTKMKNLINKLIILITIPIVLSGCEDRDLTMLNSNATLSANLSSTTVVLEKENASSDALTISWTKPDFGYDAAPNYQILIDMVGNNFANSISQPIDGGSNLQKVFTAEELNNYLISLGFEQGVPIDAEVKVVSKLGEYHELESTVIPLNITLYVTSEANCTFDQLWLVGAGITDAGWGWTTPVALACNGNGIYSGNVKLNNNGGADNNFRFFTTKDDWGSGQNFPYFEDDNYTIDSNFENANDGDSNFAFTGTSGYYYLEVNTIDKKITLSDPQPIAGCDYEQLWLVGAGVPDAGWGWATPVQLFCNGNGVYSGYVNFQNNGGADNNFRFFTVKDDWDSGQNFPYYEDAGYTIDSNFENANDGDSNFAFVGTSGSYFLTVNTVDKTITLSN
ncbi:hypothetical protein EGM88_02645 [Aureibaculum marinum]|uniref:SusE outer membrane protein domain-containing protein n=2 Tax=Aureibaculum marinum TaxID=2487930 RepID=A0A3N4P186_9FLAO|nr:hypothetical protein EGM88_02645 [Aureibaculum marinum]